MNGQERELMKYWAEFAGFVLVVVMLLQQIHIQYRTDTAMGEDSESLSTEDSLRHSHRVWLRN